MQDTGQSRLVTEARAKPRHCIRDLPREKADDLHGAGAAQGAPKA